MKCPGKLIIVRHHESEWNKLGLWTGTRDVHLTPYGFQKSEDMGRLIADVRIDRAFASMQSRSLETLESMLKALGKTDMPIARSAALNERDYGDYTGKSKWDMKELVGEEVWTHLRRDWDYPMPNGETLKDVYERIVPFYKEAIVPLVEKGEHVLVVSHGNALRALMIYIEKIPPEQARHVEMLFGAVVLYDIDEHGCMMHKGVRKTHSEVNA